eukprot:c14987_g1_i1.p1 GENE.c14987_g1_i1~~c14987_g1_i1.p1  ORF type:complete len:230 (-),score=49.18 c14987_g1_i1:157-846(-)
MLGEWFMEVPVITRTYLTLAVITTVACGIDVVTPFHLYLNQHLILTRYEVWRAVTTFCYFGSFGVDFMFHMFFMVRYCRLLEESSRFRGKTAEFLFMFLIGAIAMLVGGVMLHIHFLGPSLTFMVVYVWSRRNSNIRMSFLGVFPFAAAYLPFVLMGFGMLLNTPMSNDLLGIFIGHTYYFFEDVYPFLGGKRWLRAPAFLHALFGTEAIQNVVPEQEPQPNIRQQRQE